MMKQRYQTVLMTGFLAAMPYAAIAQDQLPVPVEQTVLTPITATTYVNTPDTVNNGGTESLGVGIASNGNVVVGWEDDGDGINDLEAVWTLFDNQGNHITPDTTITAEGDSTTGKFLAFFREDGTAVGGKHAWGPKIHANSFGPGFGMGATAFSLGLDIPELADINVQTDGEAGDFPAVQLLNDDGTPINVLAGVDDAYADTTGDIRIGDWEYLSNGNIVIVGESRQGTDLVDIYNGEATGNHAIYRIVTPQGQEVKAVSLVSSEAVATEIWHGAASTQNGFAIRFGKGGRTQVRLFDNTGNPKGDDIDIATLTGNEATATGGRGDGTGFHGTGNAYVLSNSANANAEVGNEVYLTVLNEDGSLRYSVEASEGYDLTTADRVDAALDANGRVVAVWSDQSILPPTAIPVGRVFDPQGEPLSEVFYISELETDETVVGESRRPRVAFRNNLVAAVWESTNSPDTSNRVVSMRLFSIAPAASVENFSIY